MKISNIQNSETDNPFKAISEDEFMVKLENSREHAKNGDIKNADDFIEEIRIKYEI